MNLARTTTLAIATLPALGLAAVPAHAQTLVLQSGDSVTVSGSGTTGTYQGKSISSPTFTYSTGTNTGTDVSVPIGAAFTLRNGAVLDGGSPSSSNVVALLVQGGTATVAGGAVGGGIPYGIGLQITGGTTTITGGTITGATAIRSDGGLLQVSGGAINGQFRGFVVGSSGIIDLFGTFTDGSGSILTGPITNAYGTLQGTFSNGDVLSKTSYGVGTGGILEFNVGPAPAAEPSQLAALGIGLLGLGALAIKAKRRIA